MPIMIQSLKSSWATTATLPLLLFTGLPGRSLSCKFVVSDGDTYSFLGWNIQKINGIFAELVLQVASVIKTSGYRAATFKFSLHFRYGLQVVLRMNLCF
jgi:hypothetical protein